MRFWDKGLCFNFDCRKAKLGAVAQVARASRSQRGGHGFESRRLHYVTFSQDGM